MNKNVEEFSKMFGGKKDLGKLLQGLIFARWLSLYMYYIRKLGLADPEATKPYPEGVIPPEVEEMTRLAVERMLPTELSRETSTYHGKVVKLDEAKALLELDRDISLTNLEQVIPFKVARDIILKNPDHIAVIECPCRATKENPCRPMDVCLAIGEPFVGLILEYKTNKARKISQQEALEIIKSEDARGHIHSAWFKDACGDRLYVICNCCKCCCIGMRTHILGIPILAPSGYVSHIGDDCSGCGECVEFCQFGAIVLNKRAEVIYDKCMGCGVCESKCSLDVISMRRDPAKGEPLDIRELLERSEVSK